MIWIYIYVYIYKWFKENILMKVWKDLKLKNNESIMNYNLGDIVIVVRN